MKLLLLLVIFPFIVAFNFNPMSQSIELGENQKTAQYLIENDSTESMAIELSVRGRMMDENGKEELPKVGEMTIFPPQMIIPPKEKRTIRVTYNGDKGIQTEKAYRVIAEQLPLSVDSKQKKKSGIQMLMRYMAALYVSPKDTEASLSAEIVSTNKGNLNLKITNSGHRHKVLINPVFTFKKGKNKWSIKAEELKGVAGENVLAKTHRLFNLKTKEPIPAGASVTIKVNE